MHIANSKLKPSQKTMEEALLAIFCRSVHFRHIGNAQNILYYEYEQAY